MHVVVAVFQQRVVQQGEGAALVATEIVAADQVERGSCLDVVLVVPMRVVPSATVDDLLRGEPEEKEILFARLLRDFDGGAVLRGGITAFRKSAVLAAPGLTIAQVRRKHDPETCTDLLWG
jgi:hypothetical protein